MTMAARLAAIPRVEAPASVAGVVDTAVVEAEDRTVVAAVIIN